MNIGIVCDFEKTVESTSRLGGPGRQVWSLGIDTPRISSAFDVLVFLSRRKDLPPGVHSWLRDNPTKKFICSTNLKRIARDISALEAIQIPAPPEKKTATTTFFWDEASLPYPSHLPWTKGVSVKCLRDACEWVSDITSKKGYPAWEKKFRTSWEQQLETSSGDYLPDLKRHYLSKANGRPLHFLVFMMNALKELRISQRDILNAYIQFSGVRASTNNIHAAAFVTETPLIRVRKEKPSSDHAVVESQPPDPKVVVDCPEDLRDLVLRLTRRVEELEGRLENARVESRVTWGII